MIILKREPVLRKKGYFELTLETENAEEAMAFQDQLSPGKILSLEVSEEVLFRRGLNVGDCIALSLLRELMVEDELVKAKDTALKLLDYRMRTVKEVEDKLKEKGFSMKAVEITINTLEEYRFLDDKVYARDYLKGRISQRGIRAMEEELSRKGVNKDLTRELSQGLEEEEYDAALTACRKKYRSLKNREIEEHKMKEKVYRFLMSRGYDYNLIKNVYEVTRDESTGDQDGDY